MSNHERTKVRAFSAIVALSGLLIVIISARTGFPELLFYSIVMILIGVIVVLVVYAFLWERSVRYIRNKMWKRKRNRLAREYFGDFRDFVERFTSLREFSDTSKGIIAVLHGLPKNIPEKENFGVLIGAMVHEFAYILRNPLNDLKKRLDDLCFWKKKEINYEFLSCLVKEFENYVKIHKRLYVDFTVTKAREIGLDNIPQTTKRLYSEYKDDYNQFVIAYTEFAKRSTKTRLGIFSEHLQKANEL